MKMMFIRSMMALIVSTGLYAAFGKLWNLWLHYGNNDLSDIPGGDGPTTVIFLLMGIIVTFLCIMFWKNREMSKTWREYLICIVGSLGILVSLFNFQKEMACLMIGIVYGLCVSKICGFTSTESETRARQSADPSYFQSIILQNNLKTMSLTLADFFLQISIIISPIDILNLESGDAMNVILPTFVLALFYILLQRAMNPTTFSVANFDGFNGNGKMRPSGWEFIPFPNGWCSSTCLAMTSLLVYEFAFFFHDRFDSQGDFETWKSSSLPSAAFTYASTSPWMRLIKFLQLATLQSMYSLIVLTKILRLNCRKRNKKMELLHSAIITANPRPWIASSPDRQESRLTQDTLTASLVAESALEGEEDVGPMTNVHLTPPPVEPGTDETERQESVEAKTKGRAKAREPNYQNSIDTKASIKLHNDGESPKRGAPSHGGSGNPRGVGNPTETRHREKERDPTSETVTSRISVASSQSSQALKDHALECYAVSAFEWMMVFGLSILVSLTLFNYSKSTIGIYLLAGHHASLTSLVFLGFASGLHCVGSDVHRLLIDTLAFALYFTISTVVRATVIVGGW
jgi:uncharacterized protein (DUF983 family)